MKTQAFVLEEKIYDGPGSQVFRGRLPSGELCAVKVVQNTDCPELRVLQRLPKHVNIANLVDCVVEGSKIYLVLPYYPMDLLRLVQQMHRLSVLQTRNLAWMLLEGLHHIHSHGVMHRDLKPENVLLEPISDDLELCRLAISDFSNSKLQEKGPHTAYISTRWYRAPEQLVGVQNYGLRVDIFAAGCVIAEMLTGQPLFPGKSELDQLSKIEALLGAPPAKSVLMDRLSKLGLQMKVSTATQAKERIKQLLGSGDLLADLLYKMLSWDPEERPPAAECLRHAFFA